MKVHALSLCALIFSWLPFCPAADQTTEHPEWASFFEKHKAEGTLVIVDERSDAPTPGMQIYDPARSAKRFPPASTFKIPHLLFALDAGVAKDEFQVFAWDGVKRQIEPWNADQTLRSSMRHSVVWVYEKFAKEIGLEQEGAYMRKVDYGNADTSGGAPFWVEGNLAITPQEQMVFLRRLYRNELPFKTEHQRMVKDIIIVEAGRDWILRAKTGWSGKIGWWVGWIEWPTGPVFFVLNMDTPQRLDDLPKREAITRTVLRSLKALPEEKAR